MTSNFLVNNLLTYRDMQLRGLSAFTGLLKFYAVCGIGAVANVGVATWLFGLDEAWWIAGLAGIIMGSVFNYTVSSIFVWRWRA
jgi:dolichol-phosphate mannosyltransferase